MVFLGTSLLQGLQLFLRLLDVWFGLFRFPLVPAALALAWPGPGELSGDSRGPASDPAAADAPFLFEPGGDFPTLEIPRAERLEYKAYLSLGFLSDQVGTVVQTCEVTQQAPSILLTQPAPSPGETASIRLHAAGGYMVYSLTSTLESRMLPQDWPRVMYRSESTSTQTRRREVLLGTKDGELVSSYRGDTPNGAPKGTRIWRPAKERSVPPGTLDMLQAVFQARALVREGEDSLTFPLIDTDNLWQLSLRRGDARRMRLGNGSSFDVVEIVIDPQPYPGEPFERKRRFEGVFGIQGSMHLWVEKHTGIAVRVQGTIPLGSEDSLIKIGVDVVLESWSGTPPDFQPVKTESK